MNFRQTAILLGALIATGFVLLITTWTSDDPAPAGGALTEELAGVKAADLDAVEIDRGGEKLKMERAGADKKGWEIVEPFRAPADADAVEAAATALLSSKPVAHADLSGSPAVHSLDPPGLRVTLSKGDRSATVGLGDVSIGGSKAVVYVVTSSRPARPMAVPRTDLQALFRETKGGVKASEIAKWANDYRLKSIFPGDSTRLAEGVNLLKLSLPNKKAELALARTPGGGWKFEAPAGWGDADPEGDASPVGGFTGVNPLVRTLTDLSATTAADFLDAPDLKPYGLNADNPDLVRAELKTADGQTAVVFVGKIETAAAPPPKLEGLPPPGGGKVFIRIEGRPGVVKASCRDLSGLIPIVTDPSPLRDRNLLPATAGKRIEGIDIALPNQPPTKLRRTREGDWKLYGGPGDPQTASAAAVGRLTDVLQARRAIKGFPPLNPADFTAVPVTLQVWTDPFTPPTDPKADPKAEPVKKGEGIKLEFGRKDGDTLYVRRTLPGPTGGTAEFALPAALKVGADTADVLAAVTKTRLDLLDRSLPTFSEAARIAVSGANTYTLARDEKPDPVTKEQLWRFAAPDPRAGQVADGQAVRDDIVYRLANASSLLGAFVNEAPTPEKLAEYGLNPPRLKATVGLPAEGTAPPRQTVFEFGKEASDPGFVYARVEGRAAVFTLPQLVFDALAKPDLRDRTLARFDPAKVTAVELRGWGVLKLGEQKLAFERTKDGKWAGKVGDGKAPFPTDPAKVDQFLTDLTKARVDKFIATNAQKPEYGFGDANYLIVILKRSDGPEISLNLGAPTDDKVREYYVFSSTLPQTDPFCTIDAAPFKAMKAAPSWFSK
jgi:hypothetical protein